MLVDGFGLRRFAARASLAWLGVAALAGCGGCRHSARLAAQASDPVVDRLLIVVATTEIRGTPEPCGCQSDPLGDVARVASIVADARERAEAAHGGALLVDAGGLRYGAERIPAERRGQAELKANFLEEAWQVLGAVVALGDEDLALGPDHVPAGRRLCSNLKGIAVAPELVRDVGGVKVGVFGVIDPAKEEAWHAAGVEASDPAEAAKRAVQTLRAQGAQVIVALAHMARPGARKLAREVHGIDVVIAGDEAGDEGGEPEQVGGAVPGAILIQPADQGQKVARVELHVVGGRVSAKLFAGADERTKSLARNEKKLDQVGRDLLKLKADPAADPAFVKTREAEQQRLRDEQAHLKSDPLTPPAGPYAIAQLQPVRRKIARNDRFAAAMKDLDARIGEANRSAAANVPPPAAPAGEASYVGMDECEDCHPKQVKQWKSTVHAKAWTELVEVNKQWSYDCINCHVTGYGRAGGSSMAHVDKLKAVQCEVCHGPGSLHNDTPKQVHLRNPVEADCKDCHTKEHSDTFQYEAYLRDVLGPGHGEKKRAALGPGVTGHDLRHGAIERAKEK